MGNSTSGSKSPAARSPFHEHVVRLFEELQDGQERSNLKGEACIRRGVLKEYFQCLEQDDFGQLLFSKTAELSGHSRSVTDLGKTDFIHGFEQMMDQGTTSRGRLLLYTSVFSDGESTLPFTGLVEMFQISKRIAMSAYGNSEEHSSDMETSADMLARSLMGDSNVDVDTSQCKDWLAHNCPRIFNSVHAWVLKKLNKDNLTEATAWRLPSVAQHSRHLLSAESLWLLSTNLPLRFLGCARPDAPSGMSLEEEDRICRNSCSWTILYDSEEHGQSLNRFKHHCMGYRGPTVTLMKLGRDIVAIAVDVEWRESSSSWGNSDCRVVQLWPKFQVLRSGPNIVFFSGRGRGLSHSGIVFGQASRPCVTLDEGLSSAKLHYHSNTPGGACDVQKIEVWGCGGDALKQKQKEQQKWERRQAEKLRQVKLPGKWDENPDKAILEMAGVTTNHSQR